MLQRLTALYLVLFISLTFSARHAHRNALADLAGDTASNSGRILELPAHLAARPGLASAAMVEDDSCLACFFSDVVAPDVSTAAVLDLRSSLLPLELALAVGPAVVDVRPAADRGPPRL